MRTLHLIRHGPVVVDASKPPIDWELAPAAVEPVRKIAKRLRPVAPKRLVSSTHVKAIQTAAIMAEALDAAIETRSGLEEHHRGKEHFFASSEAFEQAMADFFNQRNDVVLGMESAAAALERFHDAVCAIMAETNDDEVIVSHGAVMALLLERGGNGPAPWIWKRMSQPDYVKVEWPGTKLV